MMKANPKSYDASKIPSWDSSLHHNDFLLFIVTLTSIPSTSCSAVLHTVDLKVLTDNRDQKTR